MFNILLNPKFPLLLLFSIIATSSCAQKQRTTSFNIGGPAPPLQVRKWIKGTPIQRFEKDKVYVIDFWATWCRPCIVSMPHLSALADQYKGKVKFLAIDVYEDRNTSIPSDQDIKRFIDSMGEKMNFPVAIDDDFMAHHWLDDSNAEGIPNDFIVNADGKVAWIGNPYNLDTILPKILHNTWNIRKAATKRAFNVHLGKLNTEVFHKFPSGAAWERLEIMKQADSILSLISNMIKEKPDLKYTSNVIFKKFRALLITNPYKAYQYGKKVINSPINQWNSCESVIRNIENLPPIIKVPGYIYGLGAKAYQTKMDITPLIYRTEMDTSGIYQKMATWYSLADDTAKAEKSSGKAGNTVPTQSFKTKMDSLSSGLGAPPPPPPPPHK